MMGLGRNSRTFGGSLREEVEAILSLSALDVAIETVSGNQLGGAYVEFGVFRGMSFLHAWQLFNRLEGMAALTNRRFVAVDSFAGLPDSDSIHPMQYHAGAYAASEDEFRAFIQEAGVDVDTVDVVSDWYKNIVDLNLRQPIAVAYLDCDLRESAEEALRLCEPYLQNGTVIVLDDFFRYDGANGVRRAWEEFVARCQWNATVIHLYRRIAFVLNR